MKIVIIPNEIKEIDFIPLFKGIIQLTFSDISIEWMKTHKFQYINCPMITLKRFEVSPGTKIHVLFKYNRMTIKANGWILKFSNAIEVLSEDKSPTLVYFNGNSEKAINDLIMFKLKYF